MKKLFNLSVADEMNIKQILTHHSYLRGNWQAAMSLALFETAAAISVIREGDDNHDADCEFSICEGNNDE